MNLLVPKPKTRWREIRVRRYRVSWGPLYLLMFKRAHCLWVSDLHFYSRRNFTHGRLKFFENYQLKYYFGPKKITFLKRVWICAVFWFLFWQNWIVKRNCQIGTGSGYISMCLILICSTVSNFEFTFWKQKKRQRDRYFHFRWKKIILHSFQRVHNTFFIVEFLHLLALVLFK